MERPPDMRRFERWSPRCRPTPRRTPAATPTNGEQADGGSRTDSTAISAPARLSDRATRSSDAGVELSEGWSGPEPALRVVRSASSRSASPVRRRSPDRFLPGCHAMAGRRARFRRPIPGRRDQSLPATGHSREPVPVHDRPVVSPRLLSPRFTPSDYRCHLSFVTKQPSNCHRFDTVATCNSRAVCNGRR